MVSGIFLSSNGGDYSSNGSTADLLAGIVKKKPYVY
jgi:hypothetical protein